MRTASFDANAITQPGGLYQSINDGLLQSLMAYFQHKDRERQGERQMRQDERQNRRDQYRQAINDAMTLGVAPSAENAGWLAPEDHDGISAAIARFKQAQQDEAIGRGAKRLGAIRAGVRLPDMTTDEAAEFSRAATDAAAERQRQAMRDELERVRLGAAKQDAAWESVPARAIRGVAGWMGDMAKEGVRAAGQRRERLPPGLADAKGQLINVEASLAAGSPYQPPGGVPIGADRLKLFRDSLRQQILALEGGAPGMPQAGQPTPAVAQPQQPGAGAPTEQAERKEYLPEDGYDDDTIASLQHAGFWPGRTMEWVTLAASDPQAFAQSINKLDPVQRLAITKAVQNKAR